MEDKHCHYCQAPLELPEEFDASHQDVLCLECLEAEMEKYLGGRTRAEIDTLDDYVLNVERIKYDAMGKDTVILTIDQVDPIVRLVGTREKVGELLARALDKVEGL